MDIEEAKGLCDNIRQKTIKLEEELVDYMRTKNCWAPPGIVSKLVGVTHNLNTISLKLYNIKKEMDEEQKN
jgi:hypothetical protein